MSKIYTLLALIIVLSLVSAGSVMARDGEGLAGNATSAFKANSAKDARVVASLTDYRQDNPVASGENARILVTGPSPEAMAKSYKAGTLIGGFIGTESEGTVRANPELGEYGPVLPVGAAF